MSAGATVLDTRTLNRATLARHLLLDRADLPVLDAVTVTPLRRLTRAERAEVAEEGAALAAFLSDGAGDRVEIAAGVRPTASPRTRMHRRPRDGGPHGRSALA
ncbi:hypothetical protein Arub01_27020 [Actinomadura rubrobrunea]|uniref:Uncharacterized protein n=1 Tax=Actinomadura rubrobrunea TaxID=115335 RepID=A0A9W6UVY6_9ACTN|nr:hypothetical protein [Actinomadura rubrobrunea]GLW64458.1 hypothetical protein Arub01_27020 [Actinomadura rubrobrunea]